MSILKFSQKLGDVKSSYLLRFDENLHLLMLTQSFCYVCFNSEYASMSELATDLFSRVDCLEDRTEAGRCGKMFQFN